jgi:hypothetical protein
MEQTAADPSARAAGSALPAGDRAMYQAMVVLADAGFYPDPAVSVRLVPLLADASDHVADLPADARGPVGARLAALTGQAERGQASRFTIG